MQLVRKLLSLHRSRAGRNQKIRGLSTAELVGIIVIIGILGAVGGTYIGSLVSTANANSLKQNVSSLNSLTSSMLAAGVPITVGGSGGYVVGSGQNAVTYADDNAFVTGLNTGIADPINAGVSYKLSPAVGTPASYSSTPTVANGAVTGITWSATGTSP